MVNKRQVEEFTVASILADFSGIADPRSYVNLRHVLGDIIVISIMAVVAGAYSTLQMFRSNTLDSRPRLMHAIASRF